MRPGTLARKVAKAGVLPLGAFERRSPGDLVILLYHHVGGGGGEIGVASEAFERQMAYLAERERALSLEEALDNRSRGGVVVTFDDGYRDFHERALPVLVRHRVPALLYLATGLVRNGRSSGDGLTWPQIEEAVSTRLVSIGSHTHNHVRLSGVSELEAEEEMRRSKEIIETRLDAPCRHFAYPQGVTSPEAHRAARELFDTAAVGWRTNRSGRIDPYRLARIPVLRSDGGVFFSAKVSGLLDAEAHLYRILRRGPWRRS